MEKFFVTHYFTRPKEKNGWVKLSYITQSNESSSIELYYLGQTKRRKFAKSDLDNAIKERSLIALNNPEPIQENQALWLTESGDIYIANKITPRGENNPKKLISKEEYLIANGQIEILENFSKSVRSNINLKLS